MADTFLSTYAPLANDIATQTGIDPSVVLGIVDIETGGGKHVLGNNIFGISPGGRVAQYPDVQTASQAFISLMKTPRYAGVTANPGPAAQTAALVKSGYNTVNPNYTRLVSGSAARIGKALGYQEPAAPSAPAPTAPTSSPPPPPAGSAKEAVLADPALTATETPTTPAPTQPPAAPGGSVKDQLLTDPALQATPTKTAATPNDISGEGRDEYGRPTGLLAAPAPAESVVPKAFESFPAMRNALEPEAGYVRPGGLASVLPFAFKETAPGSGEIVPGMGGVKMDWLGPVSTIANPLLDLLEGTGFADTAGGMAAPLAGQVSPEATALLLGAKLGNPLNAAKRGPIEMAPGDLRFGPPQAIPPSAGDLRRAPLSDDFKANPLSTDGRAAVTAAAEPGAAGAPTTPTGIPVVPPKSEPTAGTGGAQPAGAQVTPSYEAIHTPAEEAAYRATAEGKKLLEPQKIGEPDLNQYIPGETVNNAEREQTVKTARELKELGIRVPEASQMDKAAAESNNTARTIYAENTAKGPVDIHNRRTQRQADIEADKATVFAPENVKGPVDIKPVIADMEAVLNDPFNRQNTALQQAYKPWLDRLRAFKDGVIDDAREAWGLRYDIDQQTDKFAQRDNPNMHRVAHQLNEAANGIDREINNVAPGYDDMLAKYKEHSRAIDEMTVLQDMFKNLRGPGQHFTYNAFQRFMKNVVDSRMTPSTDLNPFKAISEENMQRMWNLRDSLRRSASAKELAQAQGSDTMPNIIDALKAVGKMGGSAALHAYVGAHLGPGGNLALQSLSAIGKGLNDRRMIRRATTQMQNLLRPSEPLRPPPGQENPLTGAPP